MKVADKRLPSLDGVRAMSIGLVLAAHLDLGRGVPGLWRLDMGNLGVRVFFVISGFIITTLLLEEFRRTGSVKLLSFYRRRAFRILPAYYAFLGTVLLLSAFGVEPAPWGKIWPAGLFLVDYANVPLVVGHAWSLAVEEQFYLIWPGALVLLGLRRCYAACLLVLVIAPAFRVLSDLGLWPTSARYAFECVADALASGCLLAILREQLWSIPAYRRLIGSPLCLVPMCAALAFMAFEQNRGILYYTVGLGALNVAIAVSIDRYIRYPESAIGKVLNAAPVVWFGLISYSLYLWQQLFAWTSLPTVVKFVLMVSCAAISYYAIEQPMLRLRKRFERKYLEGSVVQSAVA